MKVHLILLGNIGYNKWEYWSLKPIFPLFVFSENSQMILLAEIDIHHLIGIWLRLQMDYNMQVTKNYNTFLAKLEKLRKVAAVL